MIEYNPHPAILKISYSGVCSHSTLEKFSDTLCREAEPHLSPKEMKTLLFCGNEFIQNIGFYSAEKNPDAGNSGIGKFSLTIFQTHFEIYSENLCDEADFNRVKSKIDFLNSLDQDALKMHYKEKLKAPSEDTSRGGGIGLIEVRRKAKSVIGLEFRQIDAKSKIVFQLNILKGDNNG